MAVIGTESKKGATVWYYSRRRRNGLRDPASALFITHRFTTADTNINTLNVFGDSASRSRPISFRFELNRTGVGAGVVFEFGSSTRGVAVWCSGNDLGVAAGTGTATPNNGTSVVFTNALPATGRRFIFVVAINPGSGKIELWRNGTLVAQAVAVAGTFAGEYADTNNGAVGNVQSTVNDRVPVGERVALANVAIIGPLKVYNHQRAGA